MSKNYIPKRLDVEFLTWICYQNYSKKLKQNDKEHVNFIVKESLY